MGLGEAPQQLAPQILWPCQWIPCHRERCIHVSLAILGREVQPSNTTYRELSHHKALPPTAAVPRPHLHTVAHSSRGKLKWKVIWKWSQNYLHLCHLIKLCTTGGRWATSYALVQISIIVPDHPCLTMTTLTWGVQGNTCPVWLPPSLLMQQPRSLLRQLQRVQMECAQTTHRIIRYQSNLVFQ